MAGFLSLYRETEKVKIDAPDGGDWWVEIRKVLSQADYAAAQKKLVSARIMGTTTTGETDISGYQMELVSRAIISWNLTDDSGAVLPVEPLSSLKEIIGLLPQPVWLQIYNAVNEYNTPRSAEEQKAFPNGTSGSS